MPLENIYTYTFNNTETIQFRLLSEEDSISELTKLLHRSYKALADMGFKYLATWQDDSITLNRVQSAYKCYVGIYNDKIVSTICLYAPQPSDKSSWYNQDTVAKVGQFAVDPQLQKFGVGGRMMDIVEDEARRMENIKELALDTAETAHHLINFYKKRDYRHVETIDWDGTNYKSVVLSKNLL
ncbi:GNAT family N-acetyltransferase [Alkaliphilus hydrothermalis]|uniref:GNAT superfamily N-acetyltransferase n=1 Tax=Alkaliphilus hydrothermalis TaxID=1482730 RepID=A0ABS2NMR3_9FIRM|nr:GNAT family N-acetyltransferase [Alkaliphilus hydrothermalis]MBM7614235.1 GNAT superfamily N-acetyltransferase [Alkaliphilus hydrothermalis]